MNLGKNREADLNRHCGSRLLLALVAVAAVIQLAENARADSVTFQSGVSPDDTYRTQDAHVRNDQLNKTDNNTRIVFGSLAGSGALRGLYSYPLTGIPGGIPIGATINSVEFHITQLEADAPASANGDIAVELRTISESFFQGTGVTDPPDGVNWNNTFGATMTLGDTILSSALMNPNPEGSGVLSAPIHTTFPTSSSLVAAVQAQLDANESFNFAILLPANEETSGVRKIFRTASNTEMTVGTQHRPRLIIDYTYTAPAGLPGDYNGDNVVNAADYTVWRNNLDGDASAFAPGSRSTEIAGVIGTNDYDFWKENYGNTGPGSASGQGGLAVPEPGVVGLTILGIALQCCLSRRQRT